MKESNNKKLSKFSLIDLYKSYPYKAPLKTNQGRNYIPKEEVVYGHKYSIDLQTYKNIIEEGYKMMIEDYLLQGNKFRLPHGLGYFEIVKYKPSNWRKTGIDWKTSNEVGQRVYYNLSHSEGYRWCLKWVKDIKSFSGQSYWRFVPSRSVKLKISNAILNDIRLIDKFNIR